MTRAAINDISPLFIVSNVTATLSFYQDMLGFEVTFRGPGPDDEFFGIVRRGGALIMLKALEQATPVPNYSREPTFAWDAYVDVPDPDALAKEFVARGVHVALPLADRDDDGLRGFVIKDLDGYGLFFGNHRA